MSLLMKHKNDDSPHEFKIVFVTDKSHYILNNLIFILYYAGEFERKSYHLLKLVKIK